MRQSYMQSLIIKAGGGGSHLEITGGIFQFGAETDLVELGRDLVVLVVGRLLVDGDGLPGDLLDEVRLQLDPGLVVLVLSVHRLQHLTQTAPNLPSQQGVGNPASH